MLSSSLTQIICYLTHLLSGCFSSHSFLQKLMNLLWAGLSLSAGPVAGSASTQQYTVPAAAQQPYSGGGGSEQSTG